MSYRKEKGGILGWELNQSGKQEYLEKGDTHIQNHVETCYLKTQLKSITRGLMDHNVIWKKSGY